MELAQDLILILTVALSGGILAYLLRLPLVVGYLIGGMLLSFFYGTSQHSQIVSSIADIGVALLMFSLGLEFNLSRLKGLGDVILIGSLLQILLTIIFGLVFFPFLGFNFFNSLFLGSVLALSSTAIVVKILTDKGELETLPGEIAVGWLLVQDLFTLPLIVILPAVGVSFVSGGGIFWSFLTFGKAFSYSLILIGFLFLAGRYIFPLFFQKIAETGIRELLLSSVLIFCLILSFGAMSLVVSFAVGAFLAGIILSMSLANHAIFAEIRPLRDIFSIVFFVSLGFLLKSEFILSNFGTIFLLTLLVVLFKFLVSSFLVFVLGYHSKVAFQVGVSLISVGEFAFVIAVLGLSTNIISQETYMVILSVASFSLILSSPLIGHSQKIYSIARKFIKDHFPIFAKWFYNMDSHIFREVKPYTKHVVVLGHGRVGSYVVKGLVRLCVPYVIVDYNMHLVKKLREEKREVIYGDPSDIDILKAASIDDAWVVVVALPSEESRNMVIHHARTLNKNIMILCRVHRPNERELLGTMGVYSMVQPEFEAALEITRRLLPAFGISKEDIRATLQNLRKEHGY